VSISLSSPPSILSPSFSLTLNLNTSHPNTQDL
jgi:hypothetical protein